MRTASGRYTKRTDGGPQMWPAYGRTELEGKGPLAGQRVGRVSCGQEVGHDGRKLPLRTLRVADLLSSPAPPKHHSTMGKERE
jgi:hypothetical protein